MYRVEEEDGEKDARDRNDTVGHRANEKERGDYCRSDQSHKGLTLVLLAFLRKASTYALSPPSPPPPSSTPSKRSSSPLSLTARISSSHVVGIDPSTNPAKNDLSIAVHPQPVRTIFSTLPPKTGRMATSSSMVVPDGSDGGSFRSSSSRSRDRQLSATVLRLLTDKLGDQNRPVRSVASCSTTEGETITSDLSFDQA